MAKLKINSSLKGPDDNYQYIGFGILKNNNTIVYKDEDITTTINITENVVEVLRRSSSYKLDLKFNEFEITNGFYELSIDKVLTLPIETKKIIKDKNNIEIDYKIKEVGNFSFKLNYEVIE